MNMIFTTVGLDEAATLIAAGSPIEITELAIGTANWTPDETATALQTELKRLSLTGDKTSDANVHLTAVDSTTDEYTVFELGIYLASGTLLAITGDGAAITGKATRTDAVYAIDLPLSQFSDATVVIGGTGFMLPQSTESVAGISKQATVEEAKAGTIDNKTVTPAGVKAAFDNRTATTEATGLVELATAVEAKAGTDTERAMTPAGVKAAMDNRTASETSTGLVELATTEEAEAGTDTERAMTPAGVKAAIDEHSYHADNSYNLYTGEASTVNMDSLWSVSTGPKSGFYLIRGIFANYPQYFFFIYIPEPTEVSDITIRQNAFHSSDNQDSLGVTLYYQESTSDIYIKTPQDFFVTIKSIDRIG